jgi:hypothetical protein
MLAAMDCLSCFLSDQVWSGAGSIIKKNRARPRYWYFFLNFNDRGERALTTP